MVLDVPDELGAREYLLEEPFAREGVWLSYEVIPFRIAPLPYQPLPSGPAPAQPTHTVTIAEDGTDAGAPARRQAAQAAHLDFVRGAAADGVLACGGMMLDPRGQARGSIAVTRHATLAEAEAFWAADSYVTGGVWQRIRRWRTRFAPLPYTPLPRE
ncbi:MAG: YciI family protein [Acetobacteraceae bacterium]|nr:YciI family protein [Acetobacteraceae bacterium]